MENLFNKLNKNVMFIICLVVAGLMLFGGIMLASAGSIATLFSGSISAALLVLLAFCFKKEDADKAKIVTLLFIGSFVITSFGSAILNLTQLGDVDDGGYNAFLVFQALTCFSIFVAVACHLLPMLFEKMPVKIMQLISTIAYLAAILFALVTAIIFMIYEAEYDGFYAFAYFCNSIGSMGLYALMVCLVNNAGKACENKQAEQQEQAE